MMNHVGKILSLYISDKENAQTIEKNTVKVDTKGIIGDKHYDTDIDRSILITSIESYLLAEKNGITIAHSSLGENLLIDYNPYALPTGSRFQIGNAQFEVSQPCTLCNHLSKIDSKLPKLLRNDRGIFARVVKKGSVNRGDKIYLLD